MSPPTQAANLCRSIFQSITERKTEDMAESRTAKWRPVSAQFHPTTLDRTLWRTVQLYKCQSEKLKAPCAKLCVHSKRCRCFMSTVRQERGRLGGDTLRVSDYHKDGR